MLKIPVHGGLSDIISGHPGQADASYILVKRAGMQLMMEGSTQEMTGGEAV